MRRRILPLALLFVCGVAWRDDAPSDQAPTPAQELASFRLADSNLTITLVAAEPLVESPVAIAWDARGALYVAEMRDYPDAATGGAIKRLEHRDADGVYDRATVFADGLAFPNGLLPYDGGLLVTAAPSLWFLRDNDGDGTADERRAVLSGFAEGNQQLRVNSPTWGIDHHIYIANGRSGGAVRRPEDPESAAVTIARTDLRVDPLAWKPQAVSGFSQFGLPRDDWGERFPSWNTVPFRHAVLEPWHLNSLGPAAADIETVADILDSAGPNRVYPIAPPPLTFNRESFAFFNASCGSTIYRGDALGSEYRGNAFVCEPLTSLVHRRVLEPNGATFIARRADRDVEFLASTNSWFRPVNVVTGPDGALYVVDFCRALVEHPAFVPPERRGEVDFRRGHEHGRIWKVVPKRFDEPAKRSTDLTSLKSDDLVALLGQSNAWQRDTAQRLLFERCDASVADTLRGVIANSDSAVTRASALWSLATLLRATGKTIELAVIDAALKDRDAHVREQALRVLDEPDLSLDAMPHANRVAELTRDDDERVRLRAVLLCRRLAVSARLRALSADRDGALSDPWLRRAVVIAVGGDLAGYLRALQSANAEWLQRPKPEQVELLYELGRVFGQRGARSEDFGEVMRTIASGDFAMLDARLALVAGVGEGLRRAGSSLGAYQMDTALERLMREATIALKNAATPIHTRVRALELAVECGGEEAPALLEQCVAAGQGDALEQAALAGIVRHADLEQLDRLLAGRPPIAAATRRSLIAGMVQYPKLVQQLLDRVEDDTIATAELDPTTRQILTQSPDEAVRTRAARLLPALGTDRAQVIRRYEAALRLDGDPKRGWKRFEENCLKCHEMRGQGHRVGPDLSSVAGKPKEDLLASILDPNREVAPDQTSFVAQLRDGRVVDGLLVAETSTSIRLRRGEGAEESIPRNQIEALRPTGRSLMPEGLEQTLSVHDIADLIAWLRVQGE